MKKPETFREQLSRVATEIGLPPGDNFSERKMSEILYGLRNKGKIVSFERTPKDSDDDRRGIDFWVTFPGGKRVPFQVKESRKKVWEGRKKHPGIPIIYFLSDSKNEKGEYYVREPEEIEELMMKIGEECK